MSTAKYRILVVVYCVVILLVSSIPGSNLAHLKLFGWDKLFHLLEYSILGWLLIHALEQRRLKLVFAAFMGGALFGGFDEMWQLVIAGRDANVFDWLADTGGIVLGLVTGQVLFETKGST